MTYRELFYKATRLIDNGKITLGEYEEMTKPLDREIEQEPKEKCTWIKYDYRTMCPKEHINVDNPYWRIPENRMETLKYCPYCGKEIEVEEWKEKKQ